MLVTLVSDYRGWLLAAAGRAYHHAVGLYTA